MAMYTPIIGLAVAVFALIFTVLRTRVHALIAMLIAASIAGITGGMGATQTVDAITKGFGSTLGSIGIVIGLGVMMGRVLEVSGAAEQIAYSFIKWLGKRREVGAGHHRLYRQYPDFRRFGVRHPLSAGQGAGEKGKRNLLTLGVALAGGLILTHHAVPPTPGPLGVAGIFGVDIGAMMLAGLVLAIPCVIGIVLYARWLGTRYPDFMPQEEEAPQDLRAAHQQYLAEKARRCRA